MCDDLVPVGDSRVCKEYPIEIMFCPECITGHQRFQVPKHDLFPSSYHYRARFTADVLNGMKNLVDACELKFGTLAGKKVVDIGCNDGSLLGFFKQKGVETIGIEPTDAADDARATGHSVYKDYFSEEVAREVVKNHGYPDFITFTNVFAHIEDLSSVLRAVKTLMSESTVVVIENHYLGAVLDGNQFDTFYHEHPRTYSFTSFIYMAQTLGARIHDVEFPSRYGGNIRVFLAPPQIAGGIDESVIGKHRQRESDFGSRFSTMRQDIERWKLRKHALLNDLVVEHGALPAKAFPGRAAILVKLLGLDDSSISAVFEKPGSLKIGNYLPGTRIPIRSDDELLSLPDSAKPLLNLAWHIPVEIRSYLLANGYKGTVIDILSTEDFQ